MEATTSNSKILTRMLEALDTTNDSELARFLGVSPQAISKARTSGKIPAPWPLKFAGLSSVSMDWLCFGVGVMHLGEVPTQITPAPEVIPQGGEACERCRVLEKRLDASEDERREVSTENRQLLKDNGALKLENLTLTHQLDESRKMRHEAERKLQAAEEGTIPFTAPQIIPPSDVRPRR